jgi:HD-GYP domain-containing protein (c-di-GMP phosphodiesterase class II)
MARILLLAEDRQQANSLRGLLRQDGHQIVCPRAIDAWPCWERDLQPELIVASVERGEGLLACAPRVERRFATPLLLVQQGAQPRADLHDDGRLVDRLEGPFMAEELCGRVDALVRVRRTVQRANRVGGSGEVAAAPVERRRGLRGLRSLFSWLEPSVPRQERSSAPYREVAARVAEWADRRDAFRPGHAERVSTFSAMIAEGLALGPAQTEGLLRAAMLHDIGKVALPREVLHRAGPLEEPELRLIRTHPARGAALLRALDPDAHVAHVVLCHHERPDGLGYYHRERSSVPREAFALAVAEAFDAMTSSLLRPALSEEQALSLLREERGGRFDADCVDALADSLRPRTVGVDMSVAVPLSPPVPVKPPVR